MNKKKIALFVIVFSVFLVGIWRRPTRTIELRKNGFFPKQLAIRQGETVTFISQTDKPFWPASNVHPSHMLYPEFDPKKPVSAWQFTFDRAGKWRFHDHISPEFTGAIIVLGEKNATCTQEQCWDEALSAALETKGVTGAFEVFSHLYKTDPDFVTSGCHTHAHRVGDMFYEAYASKLKTLAGIDLPPETVSCGYGFFHGLFEHFFRKHPNIALVQTICDDLDRRYGETIPLIRINCFHGAGHGLIADPPDPALWENISEIIRQPLTLCEEISEFPWEQEACMDGVFNIVANWMAENKYTMSLNEKDPFWLCKTLLAPAKESCYYELIMVMTPYENRDLVAITNTYIVPIGEKHIEELVEFSLAAAFMQRDVALPTHEHLLMSCRKIPVYLKKSCIEGIVNGFKAHGEPGKEKEQALAFCENSELTLEERNICLEYLQH